MPLEWSADPALFDSGDWEHLCEADPDATLFHTPAFLRLFWEEFGGGLRIASVTDGEDLLARAAFDLRGGQVAFLGGTELTDYLGPVGLPDERQRAAKELLTGLAGEDDWRTADLRGLPEDGAWTAALREAAAEAGLRVRVDEDDVAPFLDLPDSFDAYLNGLSGKRRHEIRRQGRRLRGEFPHARLVDATEETFPADLETFVEMHRSSPGRKGRFMHPGVQWFFRRLGDTFLSRGAFRLMFLQTGPRKLAGMVTLRRGGTLMLYNSAYDHAYGSVSPGMVLMAEVIRDAIDRECRRVDMLTGNLRYKYRFGARPRRVMRLLLER